MQTVLGSWKEIANYLGKGVRTVQRWERCSGLPIHRPSGSSKGVVIAFPPELDKWARRQDGAASAGTHPLVDRHTALHAQLTDRMQRLHSNALRLMKNTATLVELAQRRRGDNGRS